MHWVDGVCIAHLSLLEIQEAKGETLRVNGVGCIVHPIGHPTPWTGGLYHSGHR